MHTMPLDRYHTLIIGDNGGFYKKNESYYPITHALVDKNFEKPLIKKLTIIAGLGMSLSYYTLQTLY